jgi:hypothetical protein
MLSGTDFTYDSAMTLSLFYPAVRGSATAPIEDDFSPDSDRPQRFLAENSKEDG